MSRHLLLLTILFIIKAQIFCTILIVSVISYIWEFFEKLFKDD